MSRYNQGSLIVSSSPHTLDNISTSRIMLDVLIALVPAFIMSGIIFGPRAILLTITCVVSCVVFEWAFEKVTNKENTISDLSAAVTGVLLSFNLPSNLPYWMAVIGCFVAIVIVKQLFGGIGQNFVNPAITARIVLLISFATPMTTWPMPKQIMEAADAVTGPTPLGILNMGGDPAALPSNIDMFLGFVGGILGRDQRHSIAFGRDLSCRKKGDNARHSCGFHRNRVPYRGFSRAGSDFPHLCRRRHAGSHFHGYGLLHFAADL